MDGRAGTPWGDPRALRARRLPPGPGRDPEAVRAHQRERLLAATVAVVSERGYDGTRVADLIELAGVSRSTFYDHFGDKRDCFLATIDALVAGTGAAVEQRLAGDGSWEERLRGAFDALVELVVTQPAAARLCLVEVHAAGRAAVERVERPARALGRRALAVLEESPQRAAMPREIARAVLGGLRTVIHLRLHNGRERELPALAPELMDWALGYRTPPEPLRRPTDPPPPPVVPEPRDLEGPRERIVDALVRRVAADGYAAVTLRDLARDASVSLTTLYSCFAGRQEAFLAAVDGAMDDALAATVPAYRAAPDWPRGVRDGIEALLAHLSHEPDAARVGGEAVWAAGPASLDRLEAGLVRFQPLLDEHLADGSSAPPRSVEAVPASIAALIHDHLGRADPDRLWEAAPTATFVALAPAVGAIEACAVVNERA